MIRTRIAPSPTGFPHIGTIYQVLFDFAVAHKEGGQFVFRLEDTDRARFIESAEQIIYDSLAWFELNPDESPVIGGPYGPYRQSERLDIYRPYVDQLIENGHAYYCFCTKERLEEMRKNQELEKKPPMYDRLCRSLSKEQVEKNLSENMPYVVRMKVPDGEIIGFDDMIAGRIEFKSELIDDQVLLKADGYPTYHMAVVVDDHLMKITHVLRGKEWISSTPKHVLLYRFLGWEIPIHAHLPLILNADGKGKLSKRHGHASVTYYRENGYLPEAILNYMSHIVWNHPENKEIYDLAEFIQKFDISGISSQGPRFDLAKLDWVNGQWIRNMLSEKELSLRIKTFSKYSTEQIKNVLVLVKERLVRLNQFDELVSFFFEEVEDYDKSLLVPKTKDNNQTVEVLKKAVLKLESVEKWNHAEVEAPLRALVEESGWKVGELFMTLRVAVTGRSATPPLFETMEVLGKDVCLKRIQFAICYLE
jgi:glutamyl-tRNA synthetase